jgi:hypothetical protein
MVRRAYFPAQEILVIGLRPVVQSSNFGFKKRKLKLVLGTTDWASGIHLAVGTGRRVCHSSLKNLRTEIVLKDARDVAFWFSFGFQLATIWQQKTGKRALPLTHQTLARPDALFPKRHEYGEKRIKFGEDEPRRKDVDVSGEPFV